MPVEGLSPRVRGNQIIARPPHPPRRSIPACAGEPPRHFRFRLPRKVYPRVCGGTRSSPGTRRTCCGLSPRVRGNPAVDLERQLRDGSIPACAGEPCCRPGLPWPPRVYPRVCGGTVTGRRQLGRRWGLSPRVRGNPPRQRPVPGRPRSIPACAGEPQRIPPPCGTSRVYPRVCGGTGLHVRLLNPDKGLSPRVRGNHRSCQAASQSVRSIPACAGEPPCAGASPARVEVYPRVCGGTFQSKKNKSLLPGLSPRVRGNRRQPAKIVRCKRSIPACAGEPRHESGRLHPSKVYPRVCGGTNPSRFDLDAGFGLSPRVRGNLRRVGRAGDKTGSIPACAGEPSYANLIGAEYAVYPRVCGGTAMALLILLGSSGLSPRVRGNHGMPRERGLERRSIPACAGEPILLNAKKSVSRVYPRVCGGTSKRSLFVRALVRG